MAQTQIFRQAALDRLSRPELFDRALFVTTPKGWLALATLVAAAVAVGVWSFQGTVSTYVNANGILLSRDGTLVDAVSPGVGTLTRIVPAEHEVVEKGAVVAEITNRELVERRRSAAALVEERQRAVDDFEAATTAEDAVIGSNLERQRDRLAQREASSRRLVEAARERLADYRRLFGERVVTRAVVDRSQQTLDRTEQELFAVLRERDTLEATELRRRNERRLRLTEMATRVDAAKRRVREIDSQLETQHVEAPASGRVTEIKAPIGAVLRAGQPVLSIKTGADSLEVLMYIPPADGKRVEPGMDVLVSPVTHPRKEFGAVRGKVRSVSAFPVSIEGMMSVLQNRSLARSFSDSGPPYAGRVALVADPSTASGVAWTSPKGAGETLSSGTLAGSEIKVDSAPPITLVVPLLRELGF